VTPKPQGSRIKASALAVF